MSLSNTTSTMKNSSANNKNPRPCTECSMFQFGICDIGYAFSVKVACSGFSDKPPKQPRKKKEPKL